MSDHPPPSPVPAGAPAGRPPMEYWVPLLAGAAIIGIGLFYIIAKRSTLIGPALICTGLILLPWPLLAMLGGLGFIGLGIYQFILFKSITTLGVVLVILGIVTLAERGGRMASKA